MVQSRVVISAFITTCAGLPLLMETYTFSLKTILHAVGAVSLLYITYIFFFILFHFRWSTRSSTTRDELFYSNLNYVRAKWCIGTKTITRIENSLAWSTKINKLKLCFIRMVYGYDRMASSQRERDPLGRIFKVNLSVPVNLIIGSY